MKSDPPPSSAETERFERRLAKAFAEAPELDGLPGDDERIAAAIEKTLAASAVTQGASSRVVRWGGYLVATAVAIGGVGVAAQSGWLASSHHGGARSSSSSVATEAVPPSAQTASTLELPREDVAPMRATPTEQAQKPVPTHEAVSPADLPPAPITSSAKQAPSASVSANGRRGTTEPPSVVPASSSASSVLGRDEAGASAAELFERANRARRANETARAADLYRVLQANFPASREASTSKVALGRLLLDRADQPSQARAMFESYLASDPAGSLAEEARAGRALAAMRTGDVAAERSAWNDLLAHHPDSVHAERARQRLQLLGD